MITILPKEGFSDENYIKDLEEGIERERKDPIEVNTENLDHLETEHSKATEDAAYKEKESPDTKPASTPELA